MADVERHSATRGCCTAANAYDARLWSDRGRSTEARDLLAPIYGWFTEGFGTLDLKEAKSLLNALAP
jgi:predicted ATPase